MVAPSICADWRSASLRASITLTCSRVTRRIATICQSTTRPIAPRMTNAMSAPGAIVAISDRPGAAGAQVRSPSSAPSPPTRGISEGRASTLSISWTARCSLDGWAMRGVDDAWLGDPVDRADLLEIFGRERAEHHEDGGARPVGRAAPASRRASGPPRRRSQPVHCARDSRPAASDQPPDRPRPARAASASCCSPPSNVRPATSRTSPCHLANRISLSGPSSSTPSTDLSGPSTVVCAKVEFGPFGVVLDVDDSRTPHPTRNSRGRRSTPRCAGWRAPAWCGRMRLRHIAGRLRAR